MALNLNRYIRLRPFLFHLTARENIPYIRQDMVLKCSNLLFQEACEVALSRVLRRGPRTIQIGKRRVRIRDQDRLHKGNILFSDGWSIEDLVVHLNDHVFFWPGRENAPVPSGMRHFQRYASERPAILRVRLTDLLETNPGQEPLFCRYNSGAPRRHAGLPIPRGPQTFVPGVDFTRDETNVVEVTFKSTLRLPLSVEVADTLNGLWNPLRDPRI